MSSVATGIAFDQVSAVLITRGDQPEMIERIIETLPYDEVLVWDNSVRPNHRIASRYIGAMEAKHDVIYSQDDDCLFRHHAELCAEYEPGVTTAVYGHYPVEGGYGDLPLPCGGILFDRRDTVRAWHEVVDVCADMPDEHVEAYADFGVGVLVPFKQVHLPFEINMEIAQGPERLCNQPWAADAKERVTNRARAIRDGRT